MKYIKESRTTNHKENILEGFPSMLEALKLLFSTPYGTLPYSLDYGFELKDLIFNLVDGTNETESINQLTDVIQKILGDDTITVHSEHTNNTLKLSIVFTDENGISREMTIPINSDTQTITYKNILVR